MSETEMFYLTTEGHVYSFLTSQKSQPSQPMKKTMEALPYRSLHSYPKDRSLVPSNSDGCFILSWVSHIP